MELNTVSNWLANHADTVVAGAANMLVQSTVVIVAGLLCARIAARKGAAVQSAVLRATLLAVIACPAAAWMLTQAGISGWRVQLPDKTRVDNAPSRETAAPQIAASAQTV